MNDFQPGGRTVNYAKNYRQAQEAAWRAAHAPTFYAEYRGVSGIAKEINSAHVAFQEDGGRGWYQVQRFDVALMLFGQVELVHAQAIADAHSLS